MIITALFVAAFTVILSIASFITWQRRKRMDWSNVVHLPFFLAVVGMVCGCIMSIPTVVCALDGNWMFLFFAIVALACDCMIAAYLNCVIWYDSNGFLSRNFFGIKRQCDYGEIEGVRAEKDIRVFFQGHSVLIDEFSHGRDQFLKEMKKGYAAAVGKMLPMSTSYGRKWDPMNGHIEYPWVYFILWLVLGLFCAALPVFILISMTSETDPAEVTMYSVTFSAYEVKDGELHLYVDGEEAPFVIDYYQSYDCLPDDPESFCSGEMYHVGTTGKGRYIKILTGSDGKEYITLESERQVYRDNQRVAVWIFCIISPVGAIFCCLGILVARHPERYSKKVQRLFYKDGYLH